MEFNQLAKKFCSDTEFTPADLQKHLQKLAGTYSPDGFVLLQCQMMDSSSCGRMVIAPYGGSATFKHPPTHPVALGGLASRISINVGTMTMAEFNQGSV